MRAARVDAGDDAVLRPEELQADVVAERIVPCPREDGKRPAAQPEHGGGYVDVVVVGEPGRLAHRAVGVDLDDLLARDEAQRVEVVDVRSRKMPPEPAMYASGGGAGSCVAARATSRRPSAPLATASRAAR